MSDIYNLNKTDNIFHDDISQNITTYLLNNEDPEELVNFLQSENPNEIFNMQIGENKFTSNKFLTY